MFRLSLYIGLASALAATARAEENRFGVAAGLLVPTSFEVDGQSPPTDPGPLVTFTFDREVHPRVDLGLFLVGGGFVAGEREHLVNLFEFGFAAHLRQPLGDRALMRIGAGVGYRRLFADLARYDRVQGLALDGDVELSYPILPRLIGQLKLGVLSQPVGGNDVGEVYWTPIPYLAIGAVFLPR